MTAQALGSTIPQVPHIEPELDVSVVIVSYNTEDVLRDCINSVYEKAGDVTFEVIVADNASADGSAEMIADEFPQVHLIANEKNLGFAAGCNQGIAASKGRYVLLLNPDSEIQEDGIAKTIQFADAHPEAGIVGSKILDDDGLHSTCSQFPSMLNHLLSLTWLSAVFPEHRFFGRERMMWCKFENDMEVDVVSGCFFLIRREAMEALGALDERYFIYSEEVDLCYRMKQAGWKVLFYAHPCSWHHQGLSSAQSPYKLQVAKHESSLRFFEKHQGGLHSWMMNLIMLMHASSRAVLRSLALLLKKSDRARNRIMMSKDMALAKFHLANAFVRRNGYDPLFQSSGEEKGFDSAEAVEVSRMMRAGASRKWSESRGGTAGPDPSPESDNASEKDV